MKPNKLISRASIPILLSIWRKFCPNIIVQYPIHNVYYTLSLRDHFNFILMKSSDAIEQTKRWRGPVVWDLGCCIGTYSIPAACNGLRVYAFDISRLNTWCLGSTLFHNQIQGVLPINYPVTPTIVDWTPILDSGSPTSILSNGTKLPSLSYLTAANLYETPNIIKMDIEGSEIDFLLYKPFKEWIMDFKIDIYLEVHKRTFCPEAIWPEFKQEKEDYFILIHK